MHRKFYLRPNQSRPWVFYGLLTRLLRLLIYITCAVAIVHIFQDAVKLTSFGLRSVTDLDVCRNHLAARKPTSRDDSNNWYPFLTSRDLFWKDDPSVPRKIKQVLRLHKLPFGLNGSGSAAFKALQLIPLQEMPESISRLACKKCAVVGNSQSLRGRRLGKFIDSHDIVIRLTGASLKEYKEDLGEKTTIRFFRPELALFDPLESHDSDTYFFLVPFYTLDFIWVTSVLQKNETSNRIWLNGPRIWNGSASRLRILNPYVNYEATYKHLQLPMKSKKYATTDIVALSFALNLCQQVNVAGLRFQEQYNSNALLHYYDADVLPLKFAKHNITAEMEWLWKMRKKAVISDMLCPRPWSWCPWLC